MKGKKAIGYVLIALGALYLIGSFFDGFSLWRFIVNLWPALLILLGIYLIINRGGFSATGSGEKIVKFIGESEIDLSGQEFGTLDLSIFIGELIADLREATILSGENDLYVSMGVGKTVVHIPPDIPVKIAARLFAGEINYGDRENSGVFPRLDHVDQGYDTAERKLNIHFDGFAGEVSIRAS